MPITLEKIDNLNKGLEKRFRDKLIVNHDLKRTLVSFQANKKAAGYRWYKFKEGYSSALVEYVLDKLDVKSGKILDPFAGSGTSLFAAAERGLDTVGVELLPICAEIMEVRKILFKDGDRDRLADFLQGWIDKKPWMKEKGAGRSIILKLQAARFPKRQKSSWANFLMPLIR